MKENKKQEKASGEMYDRFWRSMICKRAAARDPYNLSGVRTKEIRIRLKGLKP